METTNFDVTARDSERAEVVLRRFNRVVQESGLARIVKNIRFHSKDLTRRTRRESAIRKTANRAIKRGY